MIPLSGRVSKNQQIIDEKESEHKPCDGLYICHLPNGKKSVFLIQDIFPITSEYVDKEFTLEGNHLVLPYQDDIDIIDKRAKKVSPSSLMVVQSTTITILWSVNIRAMKAEDRNRKWWNASEDERRIYAS